MTLNRALAALVLAMMLALLQPNPVAAAPPPERIQTVHLTGVCPWSEGGSKDVSTVLLGSQLLAPYFLFDPKGAWTGAVLMPYEVLASGEGLKSRHLLPGEYTRPGPAPGQPVTCEFAGTAPVGDVNLQVVGTVLPMPRASPPR